MKGKKGKKAKTAKKPKPKKRPAAIVAPAAPPKMRVRYRQDVYVSKREQAQKAGLVAHIGTSWEPQVGTLPQNLSPEDEAYVGQFAVEYYEAHPDHPYHPKRREAWDAKIAACQAQSDPDPDAEETNPAADELSRAINEYNRTIGS